MTQDIIYTLGIIIAILLLLIFLRSVLLRRQRLAAAQAATLTLVPQSQSAAGREWHFRGDPGMDVVRPEPAVTNLRTLPHTRTQYDQDRDQLPLYEAPPPEYNMVPKDLERGEGGIVQGQGQGQEQGESSRVTSGAMTDSAPPGYGAGDEIRTVNSNGVPVASPAPAPAPVIAPDIGRGLFRVDVRRAWGGFGR